MYVIVTPQQFLRQARKFFKQHPDLQPRFAEALDDMQNDPFRPNLKVGYPSIYGNTVRQGCVGTEISSDDGALLRKLSGTANFCFSFLGLGLATSSRKDTGCMETHCSINL